ncbi:MAG: peptide chain release factor N(5)-glutamine methyltransferase, partial [Terriglobia bacterium]
PPQALFAGESGSDVYARLIPQAACALSPGGVLVLELGYDAQEKVAALLSSPEGEKQWENIEWRRDLAGIVRVVSARRR